MAAAWNIGPAAGGTRPVEVPAAARSLDQLIAGELRRLLREPRALRLALDLGEAAATLGVSPKFLTEHVRPELRLVRRGRKVLVPVAELQRWLDENAALTLTEETWR